VPGKRRKKKNSLHGWLLWFALTAAFALMGLSLAAFQGGLNMFGTVGTSSLLVSFKNDPIIEIKQADREQKDDPADDSGDSSPVNMSHEVNIVTDSIDNPDACASEEDNSPEWTIEESDASTIVISIENAYPNDEYVLKYQVENTGQLPALLSLNVKNNNAGLSLSDPLLDDDYLLKPGANKIYDGELNIKVSGVVDKQSSYSFAVELLYRQWNLD